MGGLERRAFHSHDYCSSSPTRRLLSRQTDRQTAIMADDGIDRDAEKRMEFSTSKEVQVAPTFEAMHLKENLLRGVYAYGYESPSAVQSRAIVQICKGRDTIAQAQSGTGKTATFSISILQVIDTAVRESQALVLSPTRELATQIQSVLLALGDYMNVQCHACIGGTNVGEDIRKLDYGQHVVSGTPGRVADMIRRRNLRTRHIKMLVLDEADELHQISFRPCAPFLQIHALSCKTTKRISEQGRICLCLSVFRCEDCSEDGNLDLCAKRGETVLSHQDDFTVRDVGLSRLILRRCKV